MKTENVAQTEKSVADNVADDTKVETPTKNEEEKLKQS